MPYVRRRITKAGTVSTALIEAYRDKQGRPRQRLLANLHGESTVVAALAKLWVNAQMLEAVSDDLIKQLPIVLDASGKSSAVMVQSKSGEELVAANASLAAIKQDIDVLMQHCEASDEEIEAAAEVHRKASRDAWNGFVGASFHKVQFAAALRRLRR